MTRPTTPALVWPEFWLRRTPFERFIVGLPVIGLQDRAHHAISAQLEARDSATLDVWEESGHDIAMVSRALTLIADALRWPNARFVPDDPLEIVLYDSRSQVIDNLVVVDVLDEIERIYRAKPMPDFWPSRRHGNVGPAFHDLALLSSVDVPPQR